MFLWLLVITFAAAPEGESPTFPGSRTRAWVLCSLLTRVDPLPRTCSISELLFALSCPSVGCVDVEGPKENDLA